MSLEWFCVIPIRSGSVGIVDKNIKLLGGKPLVAWGITAAKEAGARVIVDTDDEGYAKIARDWGAETPFLRPEHLAEDVPTEDVLIHAIRALGGYNDGTTTWLDTDWKPVEIPVVVCVQCTTPLVNAEDIRSTLKAVADGGFDSAMTVTEISERPEWMFRMDADNRLFPMNPWEKTFGSWGVRQTFPPFYRPNGACYAVKKSVLFNEKRVIAEKCTGIVMPRARSFDIDTQMDFKILEALVD